MTAADATTPRPPLITPDLVVLDADLGIDSRAVVMGLARIVATARRGDADVLGTDAWLREQRAMTGMVGGFAIPHCRSTGIPVASLGCARLGRPVDFGATDGPADLVFLIATPAGSGSEHLRLLGRLARALVRPEFLAAVRQAETADDVAATVRAMVDPPAAPADPGTRPRRRGTTIGHDPRAVDPQSSAHSSWWARRRAHEGR